MDISLQHMHFSRLEGEIASSDKARLAMFPGKPPFVSIAADPCAVYGSQAVSVRLYRQLAMPKCRLALTKEAQQNSIRFLIRCCRTSATLVPFI